MFDQPLWLKAVDICQAESLSIFCLLGGFHMLMSFVGSIGNLMSGSGLSDALEECYGPNTVVQMLGGKSVARPLRGYFLINAALRVLLVQQLVTAGENEQVDTNFISSDDVRQLTDIYETLVNMSKTNYDNDRLS